MIEKNVIIKHCEGIHLRLGTELIKVIESHQSQVKIFYKGTWTPVNSLIQLMKLGIEGGAIVTLQAVGPDAEKVVEQVTMKLGN
ncbi:HPr family phosphocarrier protein [Evansella halocellulosilytica]|uniref:HPr family phosphocarrier protein n=1 Tax=Evansella halocellulosilytica TaxID=2011013 RepID=UPI000BB85C03|nr:HPr family phosphocarrier protein [Evansella halocellulosilytica]